MSKKSLKKATKQLAPEGGAKQSGRPYPAEPHELDGQRQRRKKAAAAGAEALKSSTPAVTPDPHPAPAAVSLKPPAALWPSPAPSPETSSKPSHAPAQQLRKAPAKAAASQASPVPAPQSPKAPAQSQPLKPPEESAVNEKIGVRTAPQGLKVTFVLLDLGAKQVSLSAEFNGWSPNATPMKRHQDGHWETTVALAPGRYQYKFIVDGQWIPDPLARENVWNQHGTLNSVVEVRA